MTRSMVLLVLVAIVGLLMLAPQSETNVDDPNNRIYGLRNDAIFIEQRSSPGSPGIVFDNIVFTEPRCCPGTDDVWRLQVFMEREMFDRLLAAMIAHKRANP